MSRAGEALKGARSLVETSIPVGIDLAMLFITFFIDTYFLSLHSELPAAAVGALFALFGLIGMVLRQVAQAGAVVVAFRRGANSGTGAARAVSFWNGAALGFVAALLVAVGAGPAPRWIGLEGEAAKVAAIYMMSIAPGLVFLSLKYTFASLNLAANNARPQMMAAVIAVMVNVLLNVVVVELALFGSSEAAVAMGVAIATAIAYFVNAALLWLFVSDRRELFRPLALREFFATLKAIWWKALPTVTEPAAIQIQWLIITAIVAALGIESLAARIYVLNFEMFVLTWSLAIAIAVQIRTSHATGAGDLREAGNVVMTGNLLGALGAGAITTLMYTFSDAIIGLFTTAPAILAVAKVLFLIAIPTEIAKAIYNNTCWALVGRGDHRFPVVSSICILFGVGLPLAWYLAGPAGLGVVGIWVALAVDESLRALVMLLRWHWLGQPYMTLQMQKA